jgi:hypothetical protein
VVPIGIWGDALAVSDDLEVSLEEAQGVFLLPDEIAATGALVGAFVFALEAEAPNDVSDSPGGDGDCGITAEAKRAVASAAPCLSDEGFEGLAKDICMQIAAANPQYVNIEDVPTEVVEKEREIYREQMKDSGKPRPESLLK